MIWPHTQIRRLCTPELHSNDEMDGATWLLDIVNGVTNPDCIMWHIKWFSCPEAVHSISNYWKLLEKAIFIDFYPDAEQKLNLLRSSDWRGWSIKITTHTNTAKLCCQYIDLSIYFINNAPISFCSKRQNKSIYQVMIFSNDQRNITNLFYTWCARLLHICRVG